MERKGKVLHLYSAFFHMSMAQRRFNDQYKLNIRDITVSLPLARMCNAVMFSLPATSHKRYAFSSLDLL